jgi:hypothetical protein
VASSKEVAEKERIIASKVIVGLVLKYHFESMFLNIITKARLIL